MLNIVIPMAGAGSRFAHAGFADPKPLIPVRGVPMIKLVIDNLRPRCDHRFIFICQESHVLQYGLDEKFHKWAPGSHLITLQGLTEGAACTVLSAKSLINDNNPLMIANADQYVDIDINEYLNALLKPHIDGMIMTMAAADPKWSFIKANSMGWVLEVAEKRVISHEATVGIYNFSRGRDFINSVELMISKNDRVNGEFYIAPSYNYMIHGGGKIGFYNIDKKGGGMHGLGTPEDLEKFIKHPSSSKIF